MEDVRYKELRKLEEERNKYKVKCKCGTKTVMIDADKTICRGCGNYVYRNKKIEFMERMKSLCTSTKKQSQVITKR